MFDEYLAQLARTLRPICRTVCQTIVLTVPKAIVHCQVSCDFGSMPEPRSLM